MHPYTIDASLEAEELRLGLIRNTPPSEREIGIAFLELNYGKELAKAVDSYQRRQTNE